MDLKIFKGIKTEKRTDRRTIGELMPKEAPPLPHPRPRLCWTQTADANTVWGLHLLADTGQGQLLRPSSDLFHKGRNERRQRRLSSLGLQATPGRSGASDRRREGASLMEEEEKKEPQQEQRPEHLQRNVLQNPPPPQKTSN